jgi:flagellar FliJ protein
MNSTQLARLLDLARISRDSAASRLARLEQQTRQARDHLQTLVGYSDDYAARLQARAGDALDPAAQANQRAFLARLRVALETQQREVGAREQASAAARGELAVHQRKVKSLETLIERRAQEELQHAARREQRHTDESAQRSSMRTAAQTDSPSASELHRL